MKFGIVGFGIFAEKRLVPGFGDSIGKIAAISKRDLSAAKKKASIHEIPFYYDNVEKLLENNDVEAVFVATPNKYHYDHVISAARHGKHVICEKPMAMNVQECLEMAEACHDYNVKFMVAQCLRYANSTVKIKEIIESGKLGEIKIIKAHYGFRAIKSDRKWIFSREFAGGGPIFDIGVHVIDLIRYLTSNHKLLSFKGTSQNFNTQKHPDRDVECSGQLIMKFEDGIHAEVSCSFNTPYLTSLEIIGTEGFLETKYFTLVNRDAKIYLFSEKDLGESKEIINVNNGDFYKEEIDDFIRYVQDDQFKPGFPGLKEGILNQIIINNWNVGLGRDQIDEMLENVGGA